MICREMNRASLHTEFPAFYGSHEIITSCKSCTRIRMTGTNLEYQVFSARTSTFVEKTRRKIHRSRKS